MLHYQKVLEELAGKSNTLTAFRRRFADKKLNDQQRWNAFAAGYDEIKSADKIQKYFYTNKFKKTFFKRISDYIEGSFDLMADIENG